MKRICVVPKDVAILLGKSERSGRDVYAKIKLFFKKDKHQIVTVEEFCQYCGIENIDSIREQIR